MKVPKSTLYLAISLIVLTLIDLGVIAEILMYSKINFTELAKHLNSK